MPKLTITVHNTGSKEFYVEWHESKVKVKGGTYAALAKNTNTDKVPAGGQVSTVYDALFGAEANRRYLISCTDGDSDKAVYFPSATSWTTDSTPDINISM